MLRSYLVGNKSIPLRGSRGWGWYGRAVENKEKNKALAAAGISEDGLMSDILLKEARGRRNRAYLDIQIGTDTPGRITFELANDLLPITCKNFEVLCTRSKYNYVGSCITSVRKGNSLIGGDNQSKKGWGGYSGVIVNGQESQYFKDEGFFFKHSRRGVLTMANCGKDRNASQFIVTLGPQKHLDGKHVAFGHVVEGMEVLADVEAVFCVGGVPSQPITIKAAGVLKLVNGKWLDTKPQIPVTKKSESAQKDTKVVEVEE